MRIAIVAPPWVPIPPKSYGGTEVVVDTLARGFAAAGHDVLLCATGDSSCPVPVVATRGTAAGTLTLGSDVEIAHVVEAYDAIRRWDADVVHDHTLIGPIYASRFGLPVVTTAHGPFDGALADTYRAMARTAALIAISHHQATTCQAMTVAGVIHHGLDFDHVSLGNGDGGFALFLGRMAPDKGVAAAARIATAAGVPLKIASKLREAAEWDYFHSAVEPLLSDTVTYVGEVGPEDKDPLLREACCLLNPLAWDEPFGLVMVEALARGTPVVATPRGSVPEIVDHGRTGFLCADEARLAQAVGAVSQLDRRQCRDEALRRFSSGRMVAEHLDLYSEVARARRPAA
jgi:glycosyltransferase involved in cell wall biosynthesis